MPIVVLRPAPLPESKVKRVTHRSKRNCDSAAIEGRSHKLNCHNFVKDSRSFENVSILGIAAK